MSGRPARTGPASMIRASWIQGECYWIVEMAPKRARKVAVTWTGRAAGKGEAIARATSAAIVGLRATAWRKRAKGPPDDLALRVMLAEEDPEGYRETLTIEPPALNIPGVRRADRGRQRPLVQKKIDELCADLATCALAAHGADAPADAKIAMGSADPHDRVEERRSEFDDEDDALGAQDYAIWTIEAGTTSNDPDVKALDGALHETALAIAVITAHGITGSTATWIAFEEDLWPDASATMRAARIATLDQEAKAASLRIATFLLELGLGDQAADITRAFDAP